MQVALFDEMNRCSEAEVLRMIPLVSTQRREQALRYKHTFGRFCCLQSWLMLAELLETSISVAENFDKTPMKARSFVYNDYGKPSMPAAPEFSISHCREAIAVALDDHPVGIDVEGIRHADPELIARTMNPAEQQFIRQAGNPERAFTRLWTRKEAVLKCQGTGIASFEQLQTAIDRFDGKLQTFETEKYIYSIAYYG
ncbi:MAG: 4'-phosphopantetheinyl transferase superfamily protein [Paludibacteraceae bacterium]|nr:4'-phosphopantetheinyl transferase superfamily protein [Paludibacteraceae bacterium]